MDTAPAAVAAAVIVDELARLGVREAVVCPGSRSAPLARALAAADAEGRIRLHVRMDERGAAFLALGLASGSGAPVPVVVTSGTAVANLAPAMVEATYSGVPLLALTADRPASYRGTGANQTIEQARLFAECCVRADDVDATASVDEAVLRARVDRMHAAMTGASGGAGHLNVRLVEPLVPEADEPPAIGPGRGGGRPWTAVGHLAQARPRPEVVDVSAPTLVIAGDGAPSVPELDDVPTVAEPTAPAPATPVHPLALNLLCGDPLVGEEGVVDVRPRRVIVLGRPTLHRPVARLLADPEVEVVVVTRGGRPRAEDYPDVTANAARTCAAVTVVGEQPETWLRVAEAASQLAADAVRDVLAGDGPMSGLHVAAAVADSLRTGDLLVLGSSNPVRDASLAGLPFPGVDVAAFRGAAGIDGTLAAAIGRALVRDRAEPDLVRPPRTLAFMGDLTFLHDAGSLQIGPGEPRPGNLLVVVANDAGGGIFETLEPGREPLRAGFERVFGTPHDVDLAALCDAYGADHRRADDLPSLLAELHPDTDVDGIRVVEARTDRSVRRGLHAELARRTTAGGR
ncbi:2-succinyl-5-enolpyruvyl-6-hydroxy-3-cyclohexene-1-carboxylic-acid synthase [Corynebacterium sp. 335C]